MIRANASSLQEYLRNGREKYTTMRGIRGGGERKERRAAGGEIVKPGDMVYAKTERLTQDSEMTGSGTSVNRWREKGGRRECGDKRKRGEK